MSVDLLTPIDRYLAEQQRSSAVERFSATHDAGLAPEGRWYADRMPATGPRPGEQYAFQVDLDRCTGCKSCVAACHSLNGLDLAESWRTVGQLVSTSATPARTQNVPSGCHHCLEPACLAGCPTNAYEKDAVTGIVRHLDDQCIGCGYCELTCPYEVPTLNHRLGIVRKCDMCADRLETGEAPACVQACPTSAITITLVNTDDVLATTGIGALVPGAPDSAITRPTTRYIGTRPLTDDLRAADHHALNLSHSHQPLVVMLVLTQLSVGALIATLLVEMLGGPLPAGTAVAAAAVAAIALAASLLHVGRPLVAYRAVLGIGHSWMSREVAAFGGYAAFAIAYAASVLAEDTPQVIVVGSGVLAASFGIAGVGSSALIYVVTRRPWWAARYTVTKFSLTCASAGPMLVLTSLLVSTTRSNGVVEQPVGMLAVVTAASSAVALCCEATFIRPDRWADDSDLGRAARLLRHRLEPATRSRFLLGMIGGVLIPVGVAFTASSRADGTWTMTIAAGCGLVALVAGLLIERYQFFVASVAPRMPGSFRR